MPTSKRIVWGNGSIALTIAYQEDTPPTIESIRHTKGVYQTIQTFENPQAIVQIGMDGLMQENFGSRYSETLVGNDLRYVSHTTRANNGSQELCVTMRSERYGIEVTAMFLAPDDVAAIRCAVRVTNIDKVHHTLTSVSSLSAYVNLGDNNPDSWELYTARSDWTAENRWRHENVRDFELVQLLNVDSSSLTDGVLSATITPVGSTVTRTSVSSRSSAAYEPAGALVDRTTGDAIFWQVEMNGPWLYQVGERVDGVYLDLYGPTDIEHHWSVPLKPTESFTTVNGTISVSNEGFDGAVAEMTKYRRYAVRDHEDHREMPVIFNDYMNTLMGNPTTEQELPLIEAAAKAGAEYYCIDCGWYDDGGDWWPSVGQWSESTTRFPGGLIELLDHIRAQGMKPGIWLEPEVIGVKSPIANTLPESAFMQRDGKRIQTHKRYLLDMRSQAARNHLDSVIKHLVEDLGVRFFKLDYNVNTGAGTNFDAPSRGEGQLGASRAYLSWLDGVLDRYPELTIETCSSGAMRADWATLSHSQLQSTSDQQNFLQYANIAASSPLTMLPEQCGNWAYPNQSMTKAETEYTMVCGLVGRLYLSGYLTRMESEQLAVVEHALEVYRSIRHDIAKSVPFWPTDTPSWRDDVVTLGLNTQEGYGLLALWKKTSESDGFTVKLTGIEAEFTAIEPLFGTDATYTWDRNTKTITVHPEATEGPIAAVLRTTY